MFAIADSKPRLLSLKRAIKYYIRHRKNVVTARTQYDLDPEKEKEAKKMANVKNHRTTGVYNLNKRERKANPTKASIIAEIAQFLTENSENACENVNIKDIIIFGKAIRVTTEIK